MKLYMGHRIYVEAIYDKNKELDIMKMFTLAKDEHDKNHKPEQICLVWKDCPEFEVEGIEIRRSEQLHFGTFWFAKEI